MTHTTIRGAGSFSLWAGAIVLAYPFSAAGTGLFAAIGQETDSMTTGRWPVVQNAAQERVGLYGGIVSAYTENGEIQSATLLILPTGYVMPVLQEGETASFPVVYYEQDGCTGREYLAPSGPAGALLPARGMVYRTRAQDALAYIPKDAKVQPVAVRSRWVLERGVGRCEASVQTQNLFGSRPNETVVTGVDAVVGTGPLTLSVEPIQLERVQREKSAAQAGTVRGVTEDFPAGAATEITLPECSPGCLMEAVGNGVCDIACYYPACNHDGGDCSGMKPEELAEELAQMCAPGCKRADIGDGFCDAACENDACDQDGGDCTQVPDARD